MRRSQSRRRGWVHSGWARPARITLWIISLLVVASMALSLAVTLVPQRVATPTPAPTVTPFPTRTPTPMSTSTPTPTPTPTPG